MGPRRRRFHERWILKLPAWARRNPLGIFIACMTILTGLLYTLGIAVSNPITEVLNPWWLRVWGFGMLIGGLTKLTGNVYYSYPVEKLGCRLISTGSLVYALWVASTSGFKGTAAIALAMILVVFLEIRVAVINLVIKPITEDDGAFDAE